MTNVLVVAASRTEPHFITFPIRVFKSYLRDINLHVTISNSPQPSKLSTFDVVMVVEQYLQLTLSKTIEKTLGIRNLLTTYKEKGLPVIWLAATDTTDVHKSIVDQVDVYAVRQLVKDRSQYLQPQYQGIAFKEYYHKQFNIEESAARPIGPLEDPDLNKLAVYWNLGMIDWRIQATKRHIRALGILFPKPSYDIPSAPTNLEQRPLDLTYRVSKRQQEIVDFHRNEIRKIIVDNQDRWTVRHEGKVPLEEYQREMQMAKVAPSPFGWGEICYRDFEGFAAGAVVLKPDMSHLDTFPNYYEADVTYVAHRWDFTDFESKVNAILERPNDFESIALAGQERFLNSLKDGAAFANHFQELVQQALSSKN